MPNPEALLRNDPDLETPNLVSAIVKRAPADLTDTVGVVIPSFDEMLVTVVRFWMPRGDAIPSDNDQALLAFDETGEPYIVCWSPSS